MEHRAIQGSAKTKFVRIATLSSILLAACSVAASPATPTRGRIRSSAVASPTVHGGIGNGPITVFSFEKGLVGIDPRTGDRTGPVIACPSSCGGGEIWDADWSPDGTQVALAWSCGGACPLHDYGIYVADPLTRTQRLVAGGGYFTSVDWSPDGTHIAFVDNVGRVFVVASDARATASTSDAELVDTSPYRADSVSWSPDGTRIAFGDVDGEGVYIVGLLGSEPRLVAEGGHLPVWSPDGNRVAFWRGCSVDVALLGLSPGMQPVDLKSFHGDERAHCDVDRHRAPEGFGQPAWSPDGRFLVAPDPLRAGLVILRSTGGVRSRLAPFGKNGVFGAPSWQPVSLSTGTTERSELTFADGPGIVALNLDTGGREVFVPDLLLSGYAWSPDGTELAYERNAEPCLLVIRDVETGMDRVLTDCGSPSRSASVDWSADGTWIAFSRSSNAGPGNLSRQIMLIHPDGTGARLLTDTDGIPVDAGSFSLSPDGTAIAFDSGRGIYTMNVDGTGRRFLTNGLSPDWSSDGTRIAFARDPYLPLPDRGHGDPFVWQFWTVVPDGSGLTKLYVWNHCCIGGWATGPVWSPDGSAIAGVTLDRLRVIDADGRSARTIRGVTISSGPLAWRSLPD